MPRVSIVLPTYNGSDFLRDSVESILNQSFNDWELIIVNDCSTDNTKIIIEEFVNKDSRIKVINNEKNQKLPRSLNIGFKRATGEYLTWTSDDNMYRANAIEKMLSYLEENKKEMMVCTQFEFVDENGEYQNTSVPYSNELMLIRDCVGACFMYRREVLDEIGEYDDDLFLVEDYEYWLRILFKYGNIGFLNENLYIYRNHGNSLTATRLNDIRYNTTRIKLKYLNEFVSGLAERRDVLCSLYFEICNFDKSTYENKKNIMDRISELSMIEEDDLPEQVIVYGSGEIGRKFQTQYDNKIVCFADKNESKHGQLIGNKEIVSLDEMKQLSEKYSIVIAAGIEKVYDFLTTLKNLGIGKCYVYRDGWK